MERDVHIIIAQRPQQFAALEPMLTNAASFAGLLVGVAGAARIIAAARRPDALLDGTLVSAGRQFGAVPVVATHIRWHETNDRIDLAGSPRAPFCRFDDLAGSILVRVMRAAYAMGQAS